MVLDLLSYMRPKYYLCSLYSLGVAVKAEVLEKSVSQHSFPLNTGKYFQQNAEYNSISMHILVQ